MQLSWLQKLFYRALIVSALAEKDGVLFEDWFVELARRSWGPDFEPIRAQGKHGDLKCDGRRISKGQIFQCYAPLRVVRQKIEDKVHTDFSGALSIWKEKMKSWQIVINDRAGLQAEATSQVELLRDNNPKISIETFGPLEIENLALGLSENDLGGLFDIYFERKEADLMRVTFSEIGSIIDHLGGLAPVPKLGPLSIPSKSKADHNGLDDEILMFLRKGQILAQRVGRYFNDSNQVERGEKIGKQFSEFYQDMKAANQDPNWIFYEFVELCGGLKQPSGKRNAALAVVAYYFNQCDIFENPIFAL